MRIVITAWKYLYEKNFDEQAFEHRDSRLMDKHTKIAVSTARQLYKKVKGNEIPSEDLGVVLSSDLGPLESILEYNSVLKEKGYVGINPSKFPNIMPATLLSRIAIEVGAKGTCVPLLSLNANKHALMYAFTQIKIGRCYSIMFIHMAKGNDCFGCFIEKEYSCQKRGIKPRITFEKID